jgi:hypothetical protein
MKTKLLIGDVLLLDGKPIWEVIGFFLPPKEGVEIRRITGEISRGYLYLDDWVLGRVDWTVIHGKSIGFIDLYEKLADEASPNEKLSSNND